MQAKVGDRIVIEPAMLEQERLAVRYHDRAGAPCGAADVPRQMGRRSDERPCPVGRGRTSREHPAEARPRKAHGLTG